MDIIGAPADIDFAIYAFNFLRETFFRCWNEFKTTRTNPDRASYYRGLRDGLHAELKAAKRRAEESYGDGDRQTYALAVVDQQAAIRGANRLAAVFALRPAISMWPRSHLKSSQWSRPTSAERTPENPPMEMSGNIRALATSSMSRISSWVKMAISVSGDLNVSLNSAAVLRSGWR